MWVGSGRVKNPLEMFLARCITLLIPHMPYVEKSIFHPLGDPEGVGGVGEDQKPSRTVPGEIIPQMPYVEKSIFHTLGDPRGCGWGGGGSNPHQNIPWLKTFPKIYILYGF